ncbi:MAG: class I mannose-6-phosphate isomerase [Bacteroidales bacterium]|nr:class I mannose-6-phosphate isomerase [Bacteroidales bacterium]
MNRIYPLTFKPIIKDKIWGGTRLRTVLNKECKTDKAGESWEISGFPGSVSRVKNGFLAGNTLEELIEVYMGDLVGDGIFDTFGTLFPLLIKFIDANDILSVQVHPDNKLAKQYFNSYGKTEIWYVLDAAEDSEIIVGFNRKVDREAFMRHLNAKTLLSVLNSEKTRKGDVFFLPPGRIHSIGSGILLVEIQQTSDATLRIYDFDRLDEKGKQRELHLDKAMEAIDFEVYKDYKTAYETTANQFNLIRKCGYFTLNYAELDKPLIKDYYELDSFVIYICLEGKLDIVYYDGDKESLRKGETILIPAVIPEVKLVPEGRACFLEVFVEGDSVTDQMDRIIEKLF